MQHITGIALDKHMLHQALQELKGKHAELIRQHNLELTKRQLAASVTPDQLIINASNAIDELDKVANTLVKRLREWYALYDPEFEHSHPEHKEFIEKLLAHHARKGMMGGDLTADDLQIIKEQVKAVHALYEQRQRLLEYLEAMMQQHTPNLRRLAGATIGAKLLAMAGSLERLSRLPSSTVQLLGAETALFRHLRNRKAKPPKHGIIFNHILLQRAPRAMRGKVARALADKISIASKVDFFKGEFVGDRLYSEVEEKAQG